MPCFSALFFNVSGYQMNYFFIHCSFLSGLAPADILFPMPGKVSIRESQIPITVIRITPLPLAAAPS